MARRKKNQNPDESNDTPKGEQPDTSKKITEEEASFDPVIFSDLKDLSEKEQKDIASFVCDLLDGVLNSDEWKKHLERIDYSWDAYEQKSSPRTLPYPDAPNVRVDFDATIVDGYVSRQLAASFDVDPIVHIEGAEFSDVAKAPKVEAFLQWWHTKKNDLYGISDGGFLTKAVEGHHVSKLVWDQEVERVKRIKRGAIFAGKGGKRSVIIERNETQLREALMAGLAPTGEMGFYAVEENETRFDGPRLCDVPGADYVFPIKSTPRNGTPKWEAHQMWMTEDEIRRNIGSKHYYPGVWEQIKRAESFEKDESAANLDGDAKQPSKDKNTGQFPVFQWYGFYRREKDPYARKYVFTVHRDTKTLCRAQFHPYNHGDSVFQHNRLFVGRGFWGFGVPWAIRHVSWVCSEMVNQMIESGFLANSLNYKYKKNKFNPEDNPFLPGRGVGLENIDDLQELNIGGRRVLMDMALMRSLREMAETRVGYGRLQAGQPDPRQRTARGVMALLREGALSFDRTIKGDQRWIESIASQEVQLFQQFLQFEGKRFKDIRESVDRRLGEKGASEDMFPTMTPTDIAGQYDFIAMGSGANASKELDLQLNSFLYNTLKDNLVIRSSAESYYALTKGLLDSAKKKTKILPELQKFIDKIEPQRREQQIAQMLQQKGASPEEIQQVLAQMKQEMGGQPMGQQGPAQPGVAMGPGEGMGQMANESSVPGADQEPGEAGITM